jgi:hypothetical protein
MGADRGGAPAPIDRGGAPAPHRDAFTLRPQPETSNGFLETIYDSVRRTDWSLLTNHVRVLLCIAHDLGVRLRDIATRTGVTERTAYGIVTDLTEAGRSSSTRTATETITGSTPTCRTQRPAAENAPSARSSPS